MTGKRKKLLFLSSDQFGYSTTTFEYCKSAIQYFDVTYIGWDYQNPKVHLENLKVHYVSRGSGLIKRNIRLLIEFHKTISQESYDLIFTTYVRGISIIRLLNPTANFLIYIDTFGVMQSSLRRFFYDAILKTEVSLFSQVAVINRGLGLKLKCEEFDILPLGGKIFSSGIKSFEKIKLLYVGTFDNRNMIDCVKGFHKYLKRSGQDMEFVIIGDGPGDELEEMRDYVNSHHLGKQVKLPGYLPQSELSTFFEEANVGVSYVPILDYYQHQTPTKNFEYLLSGLPVLATATSENLRIVKAWSGIIIDDNEDGFCRGLEQLWERRKDFCSERIQSEYGMHSWENIAKYYLLPLLEKYTNNRALHIVKGEE